MTITKEKLPEESIQDTRVKREEDKEYDVILSVKNLKTYYPILGGFFKRQIGVVKAVDGVSFDLRKRETIGLVGESGCGKTTIANTILNLVEATEGEIIFEDRMIIEGVRNKNERISKFKIIEGNLIVSHLSYLFINIFRYFINKAMSVFRKLNKILHNTIFPYLPKYLNRKISLAISIIKNINKEKRRGFTHKTRKKIQMVFQDPDASLNPRMKIVDIIGEPLRLLENMSGRKKIRKRVLELLRVVSMKREHLDRYPHEFSGGQKQRIVIAKALACNPEIIILDEPTSALDVSVQAQILNLLKDLQLRFNLSYIFITHDLSVVHHIADKIKVMYLGKFVEEGLVDEVFDNPSHPYTKALLSARPTFDPEQKKNRIILEGDVPSPINPPSGCPFHPRCQEKDKHIGCGVEEPRKIKIEGDSGEHYIFCLPFKKEEKTSYEGWQFISD